MFLKITSFKFSLSYESEWKVFTSCNIDDIFFILFITDPLYLPSTWTFTLTSRGRINQLS